MKKFILLIMVLSWSNTCLLAQNQANNAAANAQANNAQANNANKPPDPVEIYYLNAYNFNVGGPLLSNYLGRLNVFNHSVNGGDWGYNIGFTTINYSIGNSDSLNLLARQKVLIDPLQDSIKAGQKYLYQSNKYTTKVQNRSLSFFGQLMYKIAGEKTDRFQLFLHFHMELLVNKITTTTSISTLKTDSVTQAQSIAVNEDSFYRYMPSSIARSNTYLNGYYGLGLTLYSKPLDSLSIFAQATFGLTTNSPNTSSVNDPAKATLLPPRVLYLPPSPPAQSQPISSGNLGGDGSGKSIGLHVFYYFHTYINYNVTKAIQGVIGGEVRGLASYNPYYAIYAGVNLNVSSIFSALK
jgi:hypothetical protein